MTRAEFDLVAPNASPATLAANGFATKAMSEAERPLPDSTQAIKAPGKAISVRLTGDPPLASSEKRLQEQIVGLLRRNGVRWPIRQRTDQRSNVSIGTPDILFVLNGIAVAWEVKLPGKNPRPEQLNAMRDMQTDGWRVAVVRSYDEARTIFADLVKHGKDGR